MSETKNVNALNWFEIPVADFDRAKKFYSAILETKIEETEMMGAKMGFFPMQGNAVGGAIIKMENMKPSEDGACVYLNVHGKMDKVIDLIEKNGGKVLMPRTKITDEIGYISLFMDSEGNRQGLHSPN